MPISRFEMESESSDIPQTRSVSHLSAIIRLSERNRLPRLYLTVGGKKPRFWMSLKASVNYSLLFRRHLTVWHEYTSRSLIACTTVKVFCVLCRTRSESSPGCLSSRLQVLVLES